MQTFEVTDVVLARRFRMAQYSGRYTSLSLEGENVYGLVTAVKDVPSRAPTSWNVTIKVQADPKNYSYCKRPR